MNNEISYVAIALFLEKSIEKKIIELSEQMFEKYQSWWRLSEIHFPPHISLWLAYMPKRNEKELINEISTLMQKVDPINIELDKVEIKDNGKEYYVCQKVRLTAQLTDLHQVFLDKLNKYREDYINPKYLDSINESNMSDEMKNNIMKYGTRFVGALYSPHISISYVLKDKSNIKGLFSELPNLSGIYKSNDVIVFKQKESGKSVDILSKITF